MKSRLLGLLLLSSCLGAPAAAAPSTAHSSRHAAAAREAPRHAAAHHAPLASRQSAGKKHIGKASYYSRRLAGKKMADGTRFDPASNAAASKTLPLGTKARVRNLETGKSAVVEIRDRGPHVKGRILDVTPRTAADLGMKEDGVALVEIEPLAFADRKGGRGGR